MISIPKLTKPNWLNGEKIEGIDIKQKINNLPEKNKTNKYEYENKSTRAL